MSSLPSEVLEDVLQPLERGTLDVVQFINRRFLQLIVNRMSDVCLRQIHSAYFYAPYANTSACSSYTIRIDGRPERRNDHEDIARLFSEFVQALRSSRVASMTLTQLVFTPELVALALQSPIVTGALSFIQGSCTELTPTQFHKVLQHFSPTSLSISACELRACHMTDGLLRALSMRKVLCPSIAPVDGGSFHVTDDGVVDFCMQEDVPIGQEGAEGPNQKPYAELILRNGSFTKDLFKRLVEASAVSTRTQPLRIFVSPVHFEQEEDLRDFARYLSYHQHGLHAWPGQWRVYDFPGEQHGADAAMHLQIGLRSQDNILQMIRAQRPNRLFFESRD